ncbi:trypsin-like serine peptidase [Pseudomonas azotoformans]
MNREVDTSYDALDDQAKLERFVNVACCYIELFGQCFDETVRPSLNENHAFDSLSVIFSDKASLVRHAIQLATDAGKLPNLKSELTTRPGKDLAVRIDALGSADLRSLGHRVLHPERGFTDVVNLPRLCQSVKAVCLIMFGGTPQGTGFLVGRNLVLTAAHVLEGCDVSAEGDAGDEFLQKTEFHFLNSLEEAGSAHSVIAQPARAWRVAWSPSCINSTDGATVHERMAQQLDFALVRMNTSLPEIIPLIDLRTVTDISDRTIKGLHVLVGHAGGRDCKLDFAGLTKVERHASRVLHQINSVAGMSGGPLLNAQYYPVALHEGGISCARTHTPLHNRAMLLADIRTQIQTQEQTAYADAVAYPEAVFDPGFRAAWNDYARQVNHDDPASKAAWERLMTAAGIQADGSSLKGAPPVKDHEYPVFPQPGLQNWLSDEPLQSGNDALNIVALTGAAGSGKTFAAQLVLACRQPDEKVFVPETTSSQLPLADLVRHLAPGIQFNEDSRPHEGIVRNDYVGALLLHYESLARRTARETLTIVIEFGKRRSYWSEVEPFWLALLLEGAKSLNLRFVLVAPPGSLLEDLVGHEALVEVHLKPPSKNAVQTLARKLGDRYPTVGGDRAVVMVDQLLNEPDRPGRVNEQMVTLDAARILIALKRQMEPT